MSRNGFRVAGLRGLTRLAISFLLPGTVLVLAGIVIHEVAPDWRWEHHQFHALIEGLGAFIAVIVAMLILLLLHYQRLSPRMVWVASALMGMGVLDGFHAATRAGQEFVWLHSTATLVGGALFALVWLPLRLLEGRRARALPLWIGAAAVVFGTVSIISPTGLPVMVTDAGFTGAARFTNIGGGLCFLVAGAFFALRDKRHTESLVLTNHCFLFGISGIIFEFSVLWGGSWWLWHVLRLVAYLVILYYFFFLLSATQKELAEANAELEERLRIQEEIARVLRESQERIHSLLASAAEAIYGLDLEGNCTFANSACLRMLGYESDDLLLGKNMHDLIHHTRPDGSHCLVEACRIYGAFERGEETHVDDEVLWRADGTSFAAEYWSYPILREGDVLGTVVTFLDITERKMAEEALRRSEREYRGLVQQAMYGIYRSASDTFLMVNPALVEMLGYDSEAELLALDSIEELYVDPIQRAAVLFESESRSGVEGAEVRWKRKDGHEITVRLSGHQVEDARGAGAIVKEVFVEDVTERLSLEEQLRQAQRLEALGQLAGGIAHDFNNILSVIIIEAQLGMRRLGEDDPVRERLSEIKAAGDRAADLTKQLLAFSRKDLVKPVVLNLNALVTDISSMLSRLIAEDIHLTIATEEKLGNVLADRGQMEQILTNLVVNARDAMPSGGDLTIRTAMMTPDQAFLRTRPGLTSKTYAVLEVQDTGTGIADDVKARIFDPFFTTKERGKGTGLGLATVYGIVQKMDGHIEVESELEVGTTMRVYLPIIDEAETEVRSTEDSPLPLGTETVLVVEDDVRLRRIAVQLLEEQGYTVLSAEDGPQALQQLGAYEGDVHLLLTDVVMPEMGGREVAQRFQEMRPKAKVLYMSGYTDDEILHERLTTHDVTLLSKPFTAESLTAAVRKVLDNE